MHGLNQNHLDSVDWTHWLAHEEEEAATLASAMADIEAEKDGSA